MADHHKRKRNKISEVHDRVPGGDGKGRATAISTGQSAQHERHDRQFHPVCPGPVLAMWIPLLALLDYGTIQPRETRIRLGGGQNQIRRARTWRTAPGPS